MGKTSLQHTLLSAAIFAAFGMAAQTADAAFRLRVEQGTTTGPGVVITDNGAGDINPLAGAVTFSGALGVLTANLTLGTSKPLTGGGTISELDLIDVTVGVTGAATLRIVLEDDGYTTTAHKLLASVGGFLEASAGSTATFNSWINLDNLVPTLGANTFPSGPLPAIVGLPPAGSLAAFGPAGVSVGVGAFSRFGSVTFAEDSSYSLFSQATITFTGAGTLNFVLNAQALPLPSTLLLGLIGAPLLALGRRKPQVETV